MAYLIPYDGRGNLMPYAYARTPAEWRPNDPFKLAVHLVHAPLSSKETYFLYRDDKNRTYPMFIKELANAITAGVVIEGNTMKAVWDVRKIGTSFGLRLVEAL